MTKPKRPMRPEDLYRVRNLSDAVLSPDGNRVAWVEAEADEASDRLRTSIWAAPADGSGSPSRFTEGPGDSSPRWSPDGRYLAYVSVPPDGTAELRIAPLTGGVPRRLGTFEGAVSQPAWSPDSSRVVVVSPTGTTPPTADRSPVQRNEPRVVRGLAARYDNVGWFEGRRHLFVIDVGSGTTHQITSGDHDDFDPSWSPDGERIAFASDRDAERDDRQLRSDLFVVPAAGGRARRLTRGAGRVVAPAFSPDGSRIAFVGHEGGRAWNRDARLFVLPADDSSPPVTVAPATDRPVFFMLWAPPPFRWIRDDELAVLVMDHGSVVLHAARLNDSRSRVVVGGDRQIDSFSVSRDGRRVVFTSSWPDSPSECYAAQLGAPGARSRQGSQRQRAARAIRRISQANDAIVSEVVLCSLERATVEAADGTPIEYFTIAPPGRPPKPLPVHLDIHGGPHGAWPAGRFLAFHQAVATAGYLVLLPNPRGSSGYGQAFTQACTGDWGGADAADIGACVDDVIARGLGDENRLFVGGGSYGGFMTAWLVGHTHRFKAATAMAAVIDQASMIGTSDIPGFVEFNFGRLWEHADEYQRRSPVTYARDITTPVLILHWEGDLRVPVSQGEELFAALRILKRPVEFVRYPGGSHVSRAPSQNLDWVRRLIAWNERHDPRSTKAPPSPKGRGRRV
jgi:dipeptidyl aminopeptidase/acylaminoacyl peptidase